MKRLIIAASMFTLLSLNVASCMIVTHHLVKLTPTLAMSEIDFK